MIQKWHLSTIIDNFLHCHTFGAYVKLGWTLHWCGNLAKVETNNLVRHTHHGNSSHAWIYGDLNPFSEYQDHNWPGWCFIHAEIPQDFAEAESRIFVLHTSKHMMLSSSCADVRSIWTLVKRIYGLTTNGRHNLTQTKESSKSDSEWTPWRIKLFEEHRYWGFNGWLLPDKVVCTTLKECITKSQTSTTYVPQTVLNIAQWDNKRYFYPTIIRK